MSLLRPYLTTYHNFTEDDWQRIETEFLPRVYAKGDFLVRAEQTDRYLWFIDRGIIRIYEEQGEVLEQTFYFIGAGQFFADPESFNQQIPSLVNTQAVTLCSTRAVSYDGFQRLMRDVPAWGETIQRIVQKALLEKAHKRGRLVYEDAKARYQRLLAEQPEVIQQVPLHMIASYLGITISSLSRLRKQLTTEHA